MVEARVKTDNIFQHLLAQAKAGDETAWSQLIGPLMAPVRGYVLTRGAVDAEEVTAETFFHVARAIHDFEGAEDAFRSWVFVIAHRRMIDSRRRESRRLDRKGSTNPELENLIGGDVEEEALEILSTMPIEEILSGLTEQQREVLALRIVADLSLEETAEVMSKRVGAVKTLQHRAIVAARRRLEERGVTK